MKLNNDINVEISYRCRGVWSLLFYCYGLFWIVSASTTPLSPPLDDTLNSERRPRAVVDAAKRLIRSSLWMEKRMDSFPQDDGIDKGGTPGLDSSALQNDLAIVLGASFDGHEIESMVQDVRKELELIAETVNSRGEDNATNPKLPSIGSAASIRDECTVSTSQTPTPTPNSFRTDGDDKENDKDFVEFRRTADRHASGLLEIVQDNDCLEREFDVQDQDSFDIEEAIDVLVRCRIIVLRNVFSEETTERVLPHYINYITDVMSGKISSEGTTTFGGDYFILREDESRFNYMATKELVEQSTGLLDNEVILDILSHASILGDSMIVNHVGTIDAQPGSEAQYWHADGVYIPSENVDETGYSGVGGHDLPPFAINMFTPLLPREGMGPEHGPTEFCLGTSHLRGHDLEEDLPVQRQHLLAAKHGIVEHLQEFEWYIEKGLEPPLHSVCPRHLHRIPLLQKGDALLFDYMLTHRGGANNSEKSNRSMIFATYSRKWFRDTNFDTDFGHRGYQESTPLEELTRLTRFAVVEEITEG